MSAPESIELLTKSGIDFKRHEEQGIDLEYFGELLITSGLVLFEDVKWVSFHRYVQPALGSSSRPSPSLSSFTSTLAPRVQFRIR
jgi:hypothetical protein